MKFIRFLAAAVAAATSLITVAASPPGDSAQTQLAEVASFRNDRPIAFVVSKSGRRFVNLPYSNFSNEAHAASVVEVLHDGPTRPFPNAQWNQKSESTPLNQRFLNVQSITVDSVDRLWVLDTGSPRRAGVIDGAAKLVAVDLRSDRVVQTVVLGSPAVQRESYLNDLRVDALRGFAYVTDSSRGGIIVVNLNLGDSRMVLTQHRPTEVRTPLMVEGISLAAADGGPQSLATDGIALDAKGEWVYFMYRPLSGSRTVYRILARDLRDTQLSEAQRAARVEVYALGAVSDGIEIDPDGFVYFTDVSRNAVSRVRPGLPVETVVQDARLRWPDALAFDEHGHMYVTVAQFHLLPGFNQGIDKSAPPYAVYRFQRPPSHSMTATDSPKPHVQGLLDRMAAAPRRGISINEQRDALSGLKLLTGPADVEVTVRDINLPSPHGTLPVRVYRVGDRPSQPALLWFHSGSWVKGNLDLEDVQLRAIAKRSGSVVISVGYRLAPEHPFPAANDDGWAALQWLLGHASHLGVDPGRIAVGGNSAGGGIAAALVQKAAQNGTKLTGQVLVHPMLDLTLTSASWDEFGDRNFVVNRKETSFNVDQYVPAGLDRTRADVSPLFARSLQDQPPTLIITAGADPIRDDGERYALRLAEAGTRVKSARFGGMVHGFFLFTGVLQEGRDAVNQIGDWLKQVSAR